MKKFYFILTILFLTSTTFAQKRLDSAYALFRKIDWTDWNAIDTENCKNINSKYVTRQKYSTYFNILFYPGVSKDTVEKYLGVSGEFIHSEDHNDWNGRSELITKSPNSYSITYDCQHKEWISKIFIFYKNGKLVKYTRAVIGK